MAFMNHGRPCAACLVRIENRVGSEASLSRSANPGTTAAHSETIYLASRTEQARDRRIATVRRRIVDAVARVK
jgi:hypothetical protein